MKVLPSIIALSLALQMTGWAHAPLASARTSFLQTTDTTITIADPRFKSALLASGVDKNKNKQIELSEALAVTELNIVKKGITSLTGIGKFKNLRILDCSKNALTSLDLHANSQLTSINCALNSLQHLQLPFNGTLYYLACGYNQLTWLDLQNSTLLINLTCQSNQFTSLDVSHCQKLSFIRCDNNLLSHLYLGLNPKLTKVLCDRNVLSSLDLTHNPLLGVLSCQNNQLTALDLRSNGKLTSLDCRFNQISAICVPDSVLQAIPAAWLKDETAQWSDCSPGDSIVHFEDPEFKKWILSYFYDYDAGLTYDANQDNEIEKSEALLVTSLYVSDFSGTQISLQSANLHDLRHFPNLTSFAIEEKPFTSLDFKNNKKLEGLYITNNPNLTTLRLDSNQALKDLTIISDVLQNLDLSPCKNLENLILQAPLLYLDLRHNDQLVMVTLDAPLTNNTKRQVCNPAFDWCNFVSSIVCINPLQETVKSNWSKDITIEFETCATDRQGVSLEEQVAAPDLALYPNPAVDQVHVASKSPILWIKIRNAEGKELIFVENTQEVNISTLEKGLYMAEIVTELGHTQKKLMVK